jgi:hypothetical protein
VPRGWVFCAHVLVTVWSVSLSLSTSLSWSGSMSLSVSLSCTGTVGPYLHLSGPLSLSLALVWGRGGAELYRSRTVNLPCRKAVRWGWSVAVVAGWSWRV